MNTPTTYAIRVDGHLDDHWSVDRWDCRCQLPARCPDRRQRSCPGRDLGDRRRRDGLASAQTVIMRGGPDGEVLARAGWASAFFWVLGMGSRFAFIFWITHSGAASIADFSVQHAITGSAWTVALLAMAVCEVVARSALMAARRQRLHGRRAFEFA
ncbi:MAG: hypothetical protein ACLP22_16935 [Solirubrobacteraceae bacterium]